MQNANQAYNNISSYQTSNQSNQFSSLQMKKSSPLKLYNPMYTNFDYEHIIKYRRDNLERFGDTSTISYISDKTTILNNDIYMIIPILQDLINMADYNNLDNVITQLDLMNIFKKIRIVQENGKNIFKYFDFKMKNYISISDFFSFVASDIKNIDINNYSRAELALKLLLHIYRAIASENPILEINHLIKYMKNHKKLDIDLLDMLELLEFSPDPVSGLVCSKQNVVIFLNRNTSKVLKSLTPEFIARLQILLTKTKSLHSKEKFHSSNSFKPVDSLIEPPIFCDSNPIVIPSSPLSIKLDLATENFAQPCIVKEKPSNVDENLHNLFSEVPPTSKGWLMRKSQRYENKWSMVFYDIKDGLLISSKPTSLKKSIDLKYIELHKCSFLEFMKKIDFDIKNDSIKNKRSSSNPQKIDHNKKIMANNIENLNDKCFFIANTLNSKTYLIRSPENSVINSIIKVYLAKEKHKIEQQNPISHSFQFKEPEYSGVIEIAYCNKKCITKFHSNLKEYSFKKQFLRIANGKFNIYDMKIKDNLNLSNYKVSIETELDLTPQTNPYLFSLSKIEEIKQESVVNHYHESYALVQNRINLGGISNDELSVKIQEKTNFQLSIHGGNNISPKNAGIIKKNQSIINEISIELKEKKFSINLLNSIFLKISNLKKPKNKPKIIVGCDTDSKRRHWMIILNYHINLCQNNKQAKSVNKDSFVTIDECYPKNSLHEVSPINNKDYINTTGKKLKINQSLISFKAKIDDNPDYYNIYKKNDDGMNFSNHQSVVNITKNKDKKPLITEPDASKHLDTEDILLTFTHYNIEKFPNHISPKNQSKANGELDEFSFIGNHEIKSFSETELWQKFIFFFLSEKHECSEFNLDCQLTPPIIDEIEFREFEKRADESNLFVKTVLFNCYNSNYKK